MAKSKDDPPVKMKRKEYDKELRKLQVELVALQEWVKKTGTKICIVFEGRDTAGKGGTIKAITERVSARVFRVVALPSPTDREKTQMYMQRYVPHFPAGGEIVIFDRSWYNRAGVEPVMGYCTPDGGRVLPRQRRHLRAGDGPRRHRAHQVLDRGERAGADEAAAWRASRSPARSGSCRTWTSSRTRRWYDYSRARDRMFEKSDTALGALERRRQRRQASRPAQPHHAPLEPGALHPARDSARSCSPKRQKKPADYVEPAVLGRPIPTPY